MTITPLSEITPIPGDDLPYNTMYYRDIPNGYRFKNLDWICISQLEDYDTWREELCEFLDAYYSDWEVNGVTIASWFKGLQNSLDRKGDNLRKMLQVYEDDISLPILGRTITRTHTQADGSYLETVNKGQQITSQGDTTERQYDLPVDNQGSQQYETSKTVTSPGQVTEGARQDTRSLKDIHTDEEVWSDVGVRPNYETLEGFWQQNPTAQDLVIDIFRDDFMISEGVWIA